MLSGQFGQPVGWLEWQRSNFALSTLYYGEYKNFGPASSTRYRVKWPGFHIITSANVASQFTVSSLIAGRSWLPATGVPYTGGYDQGEVVAKGNFLHPNR
ncbi:putative pectinesterase/pectinesterase inhibitor 60 [Prunus yedoensis var. nudiflora]|uniref:Putative pectinesterase/pectinesterase inhibitor 60 n=1 Tax=Prunus yedoensis var. nudiflora TaxID=2094558 RepID=A0A314V0M0_PRUYE|nr:putative pectinesterase/pectinesterase inhibitor 60 [Prunus yedoensis var. nudiflora]